MKRCDRKIHKLVVLLCQLDEPKSKEGFITQAQVDSLLEIIKIQEETIKNLADQLKEAEAIQKTRCRKCEQDMEIYKSQIRIKDKRMERKDKWIAELLKLPIQDEEEDA